MSLKRIAAFVSGGGSNMQAVLDAISRGEINGSIVLVISSSPTAYAIQRINGKIDFYITERGISPEERDQKVLALLQKYNIDLCILAGYLSVVSSCILNAYKNAVINIHPALIPSFCGKGFYGHHVHEAVLKRGAKISGCTTHFVSEVVDGGPIIMQRAVEVLQDDTPETLAARILVQEHIIMPESVKLFCLDKLSVNDGIVKILQ